MASIKKKINELTPKADPVLGDSIVISDSENSGKGALVEITDLQTLIGGGGGGGAVDSVAGKTGVVTLDADDVSETSTKLWFTDTQSTKLTGIAEGAEVNTVDSVAGKTGVVTLDADDVSPTSTKLWMSDTQSTKLAGIAENANNYTHPETHPQSMIVGLADALAAKAPLASPALTGTPTAPTAETGTNTTQIATTEFCGNFNQKWTYTYFGAGGSITGEQWKIHGFGATGTLTVPLAASVASGVQIAAIVVRSGTEVVLTRSGSDQFLTPTGLATTYTLRGNGSSIVLIRVSASAWACLGAPDSMIAAATASAIYDLPVTRSGVVSSGTDVVLLETGVLDPAWYDETHVLNVSFFAKNESGVSGNTALKLQLYDEGTSTAHTIASVNEEAMDFNLLQASIYRTSSSSVNCNIQYGYFYGSGSASLAVGSYKLRVVCTSTLSTVFGSAQVRVTK